jgi:hypothetical protein
MQLLIPREEYKALAKFLSGEIQLTSKQKNLPTFNFTDSTITVEELIEITNWISRSFSGAATTDLSLCISRLVVNNYKLIQEEIKDKPEAKELFYNLLYHHEDTLLHLEAYKHYSQKNDKKVSIGDHHALKHPPILGVTSLGFLLATYALYLPDYWKTLSVLPLIGGIWGASYLWNEHKEYEGIVNNIQEDYFYKLEHCFDDSFILDHCFDNTAELAII